MDYDKEVFPDEIKEILITAVKSFDEGKPDESLKLLKTLDDAGFTKAQEDVQKVIKSAITMIDSKDYDGAKTALTKLLASFGYSYPAPGKAETGEKQKIVFHASVKGIDEDNRVIEGYASITGIADREGEVMDKDAFNKGIDDYMQNPVLLYAHDVKKPIGKVMELAVRPAGLWIKAKIAQGTQAADEVWNLIKQGVLKAFSVGGFYEREKEHLKRWDLTEISVCSVPTNQRALFSVAKAFEFGTDLVPTKIKEYIKELESMRDEMILEENKAKADKAIDELRGMLDSDKVTVEDEAEKLYNKIKEEVKSIKMPEKDELIKETTQSVIAALDEREKASAEAAKSQKEHDDAIATKAVEDFKNEMKEKTKSRGLPFEFPEDGGQAHVSSKFDGFDTVDLTFMHQLIKSSGKQVSTELVKALSTSVKKDIDSGFAQKMMYGVKSDEVMYSTQSGYGDEWVPTLWSAVIWKRIMLDAKVAAQFPSIEMPSQPYEYPLESTGPTVYKVAEATDESQLVIGAQTIPDSKAATAKVTFSAGKLGALTYFTEDFVEDSIIPVLPQLRAQFSDAMTRAVDEVCISGDETTGTSNISYDGASIAATSRYLIVDGLRHEALVTTSTDSRDCGDLTVDDFGAVRALMGTAGKYGVDASKLVCVCDPAVWHKAVLLDEVLTVDKLGSGATILTGQVGSILGMPVVASEEYSLTDTAGKISSTGGNNTKGSFIIVRKDGVMLGWRRHVKMTVGNVPFSDAHFILATVRFDIQYFGAGMVGLGYNVTI